MEAIKEYFNKLRHDDKHHLGLGDIRLTIGQQEEIIRLIEEEFKKVYLPQVSNNEVSVETEKHKCINCGKEYEDIDDAIMCCYVSETDC